LGDEEAQQPAALGLHCCERALREREMADHEHAVLDPPDGASEAVDEHGSVADTAGARKGGAVVLRDDATSVRVREQHVVVLGQEADRRGRLGRGSRCVGKVVELPAPFVAEHP
jgi:hypothetical protein